MPMRAMDGYCALHRAATISMTMTGSEGRACMVRGPLLIAIRLTPPIPMMAVMAAGARRNAIMARLPAMVGPIAIGVAGVAKAVVVAAAAGVIRSGVIR